MSARARSQTAPTVRALPIHPLQATESSYSWSGM